MAFRKEVGIIRDGRGNIHIIEEICSWVHNWNVFFSLGPSAREFVWEFAGSVGSGSAGVLLEVFDQKCFFLGGKRSFIVSCVALEGRVRENGFDRRSSIHVCLKETFQKSNCFGGESPFKNDRFFLEFRLNVTEIGG